MQCEKCGEPIYEFLGRWFSDRDSSSNNTTECYPYHAPKAVDLAELRMNRLKEDFLAAKSAYETALAEYLTLKYPENTP